MFSIFDRGCCTTSAEITTARWKHFNGRKSRANVLFGFRVVLPQLTGTFVVVAECLLLLNVLFCIFYCLFSVCCFFVSLFLCFFVSSGPSCIGKTITVCGTSWVRRWPTAVEVNKPFPRTKKHCPLNPSRWHVLIVMPTLLLVSALLSWHRVSASCFCLSLPINTIFETRFLPQAFYFSSSEMTTTIQYDSIVISVVFHTSFNFFHPFQ